jgi:hypothetical protein
MLRPLIAVALTVTAAPAWAGAPADWATANITAFNNEAGAKEWDERCGKLLDPVKRTGSLKPAETVNVHHDGKCVYFEIKGQPSEPHWVMEGAVTLDATKGTTKDACKVYAQAGGATVEAATMGAGDTGSKRTCGR